MNTSPIRRLGIAAAVAALAVIGTSCTPEEIELWRSHGYVIDSESVEPAVRLSVETHCYDTPGGTLCAQDGTPEAALYSDLQRRLYDGVGVADPGPGDVVIGYEPPGEPEPTPANVRCFVLVGGTFCYEQGTADYDRALADEAAYLSTDHNLVPVEQTPLP